MRKDARIPIYRGRFADWDKQASVRAKPIRTLGESEATNALFFSPELVPTALHPIVARRGPRAIEIVLARHLIRHLDFTDALENEIVTPVAYALGRGALHLQLSRTMQLDARRIAVDEMHHALCAASIAEEIAQCAAVERPLPSPPPLLDQLKRIASEQRSGFAPLVKTFFAVVSETLITSTLQQVPADPRVLSAVRQVLGDHAEDEVRHHAFFADFFAVAWPQLEAADQGLLGPLMPQFIKAFLQPDTAFEMESLRAIGLSELEIGQILEESYGDPRFASMTTQHAAATLRYLKRNGVLEDTQTADAFLSAGFGSEHVTS